MLMYYTKSRRQLLGKTKGGELIMDFSQRGERATPAATQPAATGSGVSKKKKRGLGWLNISFVTLLFGSTILVLALIVFLVIGGPNRESKFVNTGEYQAVFLNNGQVYFGHIKDLNSKFLRVQNIYYLRQTQSPQPDQSTSNANSNFSLVKLGCEIHGPSDEMVINRDQITFWENLKSDGQVAKAVDAFVKQNPTGQQCSQTTQNTTTPTTPSTTKKP